MFKTKLHFKMYIEVELMPVLKKPYNDPVFEHLTLKHWDSNQKLAGFEITKLTATASL